MPTEVSFFSFSSLAYMHIRTATLRQTMCQTRFPFSSLAVLTAATPTIKGTVNPSVHKKTTRFSSKDVRVAHQTKYSEPFPSLENNRVFFTSNSNGSHANQTWYCELLYSLDNIIYAILMAPTPTGQDLVNYCIR